MLPPTVGSGTQITNGAQPRCMHPKSASPLRVSGHGPAPEMDKIPFLKRTPLLQSKMQSRLAIGRGPTIKALDHKATFKNHLLEIGIAIAYAMKRP